MVATLDSLELKGLQNMLVELYATFAKKTVVLINKVFPETRVWSDTEQKNVINKIEKLLRHPVIGVIPCYCDVLQTERTELIALTKPHHPFVKSLEQIAQKLVETLQE